MSGLRLAYLALVAVFGCLCLAWVIGTAYEVHRGNWAILPATVVGLSINGGCAVLAWWRAGDAV